MSSGINLLELFTFGTAAGAVVTESALLWRRRRETKQYQEMLLQAQELIFKRSERLKSVDATFHDEKKNKVYAVEFKKGVKPRIHRVSNEPPRFASGLFELLTPYKDQEAILGDLQERYTDIRERRGLVFARVWYWFQVIGLIRAWVVKTGIVAVISELLRRIIP